MGGEGGEGGIRGGKELGGGFIRGGWRRILGRTLSIGPGRNFVFGIDTVDRGCWRFWARRARISVDILELGRFPSWQGGQ
jgi:hypothetical protein